MNTTHHHLKSGDLYFYSDMWVGKGNNYPKQFIHKTFLDKGVS